MLRISKLTDYATVVLASLARDASRYLAATELAERTHLNTPTVSKILKELQRAKLVSSARGSHGGYRLARSPDQISAAQILDVFEGPVAITECSSNASQCGIAHTCGVGGAWQRLNAAIRHALEEVTLRQLAGFDAAGLRVAQITAEMRSSVIR